MKPGKGELKHNNLKKKKRQRNTAQMKEQTRNTEVQIKRNGKSPEKELRVMIVNMIKILENKMEKRQESVNKDLEELKINIQTQTTQLLKLKIL